MTEDFDWGAMSGEGDYRKPRALDLNKLSLNGDKGVFRKTLLVGKAKDVKPEELELGESVKVTFLKVRRRLVERGKKGEIERSTNEHNSKYDTVVLHTGREREVGVAADLREKYEGLRTVQIVYALLENGSTEPELVRLEVKGASLGSEAKEKSTKTFYDHIQHGFGPNEHIWEYKTTLKAIKEKGAKEYYCMDFIRGEKLTEDELAFAKNTLKKVHDNCVAVDAARVQVKAPVEAETEVDTDLENVNPDEIPF